MSFNPLTFLFELINFLLLVWLLRKLLYKPVIQVLADRRRFIQERLEAARAKEVELEKLQSDYQHLLIELDEQREQAMTRLRGELEQEKGNLQKALQADLDNEKLRARSFIENEKRSLNEDIRQEAIQAALHYTIRFLRKIKDPLLEQKLVSLALETVESLVENRYEEFAAEIRERGEIQVETAVKVGHALSTEVIQALQKIFGEECPIGLHYKPELEAGVRIYLGSHLVDASLRGHLETWGQELETHVKN
ncbi:hypothetical protein COW36_18245 [bacterium (Candidatus Blackallbacteria) CG17_big_fil_post_rev_8_21_14_2_50_48_46]|uniref:ATP synthase subunit b n=1 Tax=bacterium (Candidatus Blackallbacteria) CG17_big_fil_post_rev_8_21_14_2_50_48_46 TaxID=2014261 RepID=A0A2M7G1E2_9BACT|nr:MAG: hypothetical protein COW64_00490 [bacterium (Candidatus Blackallbacteria) CG18_big_fil_WC_8_21_14_2_50_49_26]PIW15357.1 MAG: hypothetical protein COW36_18245 [bacterium (Candidatus Blackallbacteria) CG17_big_fil_post_rev_8_21_14_2_50_48_46]PIW49782.1 MAG: hypothetical protein COW20_05120 [bacterium (Candidatus Blackallbacteria) CG13_big_fil_rev_8_21_14_2_50_49_14]